MDFLTHNAIRYTINHLLSVALPGSCLNPKISKFENKIDIKFGNDKLVHFYIMSPSERLALLKCELSLINIKSFDQKVSIPIFPVKSDSNFFFIRNEQEMVINMDIITLSYLMLSRYEETVVKERDNHGRFQYKNSLSYYYHFIDIPIVDEYAFLLRDALLKFTPNVDFKKNKGKVIPTHDIDNILRFGSIKKNLKTIIGGDLLIRRSIRITLRSILQLINTKKNVYNDPYIQAILRLIEISKNNHLCSEFYFMGLVEEENDARYNIFIPEIKYCVDKIKEANMFIGLHGGYDSFNNKEIFKREKNRLKKVIGYSVEMGRQHYLRFDINETIGVWEENNIFRDTTLGYAEREGFRCGTCHEYLLFNIHKDCVTSVKEFPLIVMECTLFEYRKLSNESAFEKIEYLYERCMAVEGNLVLLWHNGTLDRDYEKRFNEVYLKFINRIGSQV